jgi:hypothetical protein
MTPLPRLALLAALLFSALAPVAAQQPAGTPPILPNPALTPGDTLDVTLADIQEKGYSAKVRNVPVSVKREVYAAYGIEHWEKGEYEVDHLISLSLGGSNSKKNLWPQSYKTSPWNAHTKDQLEVRLLKLVRGGQVELHTAQQEMAEDWIAAYKRYVNPTPITGRAKSKAKDPAALANAEKDEDPDNDSAPATAAASPTPGTSANATTSDDHAGQVWVNTKSGVVWKPGSTYYGKTKEGRYMTEDEAVKAGYHVKR